MGNLEQHLIAGIFPMMEGDEFELLVANIKQEGLHHPIVLFEGKILDGRNRYQACLKAGVAPQTRNFDGDYEAAVSWVWSENRTRRHLTSSQRAACAEKRRRIVDAYREAREKLEAEARKRVGGRPSKQAKVQKAQDEKHQKPTEQIREVSTPSAKRHSRETSTKVAQAEGTNPKYIDHVKTLSDEELDLIAAGEKTVTQSQREKRKEEAIKRVAELPSDKYRVVYADPPWSYGNSGIIDEERDNYGHVHRHYPSMTIQQLCDLDIAGIVEENAVLFMWVTSPLLAECWPVIKAWGFKYKTSFVWDKVKHNFGHYNSVRHELLLVCTRGSCTPDEKKLFDSVQSIEKTDKHSEKPEEFRNIIDTLYPHGKRIELFARAKADNWEVWGSESGEAA